MDFIYDIITRNLNEAKADIITNMRNNGKYVSGKTASLFEVKGTNLLAPSYYETLEKGRKEGKLPYSISQILLKWATSKGLSFNSQSDANRWAFMTAKKIREEGTKQYRDGQYKDIYSSVIEDTIDSIKEDMQDSFGDYVIDIFKE